MQESNADLQRQLQASKKVKLEILFFFFPYYCGFGSASLLMHYRDAKVGLKLWLDCGNEQE